MRTFEIGTCFSQGDKLSNIDAAAVATAVAEFVDQEDGSGYHNGGAWFSLRTHEIFCGTRRAHTNVNFTVKVPDMQTAIAVRDAVNAATGHQWNAPTQDFDELEKEMGDRKTWGMFSAEGAGKVQASVDLLEGHLRSGALSPVKLDEAVDIHCKAIAREGHGEVFDTAVREEIWGALDRVLEELGVRLEVR